MLLRRLGGRGTDCYIEILKRVSPLRARFSKAAVKTWRGFVVVDEVLPAYTIRSAIGTHRIKTDGARSSWGNADAYVAQDGRLIWGDHRYEPTMLRPPPVLPEHPEANIHQVEARCFVLGDLTGDELVRISEGLHEKAVSLGLVATNEDEH
jgi:hypothetical protein